MKQSDDRLENILLQSVRNTESFPRIVKVSVVNQVIAQLESYPNPFGLVILTCGFLP